MLCRQRFQSESWKDESQITWRLSPRLSFHKSEVTRFLPIQAFLTRISSVTPVESQGSAKKLFIQTQLLCISWAYDGCNSQSRGRIFRWWVGSPRKITKKLTARKEKKKISPFHHLCLWNRLWCFSWVICTTNPYSRRSSTNKNRNQHRNEVWPSAL